MVENNIVLTSILLYNHQFQARIYERHDDDKLCFINYMNNSLLYVCVYALYYKSSVPNTGSDKIYHLFGIFLEN